MIVVVLSNHSVFCFVFRVLCFRLFVFTMIVVVLINHFVLFLCCVVCCMFVLLGRDLDDHAVVAVPHGGVSIGCCVDALEHDGLGNDPVQVGELEGVLAVS